MALSGQASGGWTESSSALRILHVGIRNTVGILTTDAFTQTNPAAITNTATFSTSGGLDTSILGILSGSVAFTRPDGGSNEVGGPGIAAQGVNPAGITAINGCRPLGVFINTAAGNAYENQPAVASGKGPYVSGQGTYANSLFETQNLTSAADLTYATGDLLYASCNGFLTNLAADEYTQQLPAGAEQYLMGILKMPADAVQPEIVYDQRV
jgi:hypothetical protein